MLGGTKVLEKIETTLEKLETPLVEKPFSIEIDDQETIERLKIKKQTEKLKQINKIEGHKRRMESTKDATKEKQKTKV